MIDLLARLLCRKPKYVAPWYSGYVMFPEQTDEIAIVMPKGKIIRINSKWNRVTIEENKGTYLNTKLQEIFLDD